MTINKEAQLVSFRSWHHRLQMLIKKSPLLQCFHDCLLEISNLLKLKRHSEGQSSHMTMGKWLIALLRKSVPAMKAFQSYYKQPAVNLHDHYLHFVPHPVFYESYHLCGLVAGAAGGRYFLRERKTQCVALCPSASKGRYADKLIATINSWHTHNVVISK